MKKRNGFVSNSSSSSFVCDICGHSDVAYEGSNEIGMMECECGHVFCFRHAVNTDQKSHLSDDWTGEEMDFNNFEECSEYSGYSPSIYCPICNMEVLSTDDYIKYMRNKGFSKEAMLEEIRSNYKDYAEFHKALNA